MKSNVPATVKNKDLVEKRREQIIYTSINLFSKKGFYKTTLKDLAREAGISHGNIYDYVGSKEDILFLIHEFLHNKVMEALNRSKNGIKDPVEKLRRMVRAEFNMMDPFSDGILLLHREAHIIKTQFLIELLKKERAHLKEYELVIQECIDKGVLRECNLRLSSNLIKSMIDSIVMRRWDIRRHVSPKEAEKAILDMIFQGLCSNENSALIPQQNLEALQGKAALVINASTEIGSAIVSLFLANGAKVAVSINKEDSRFLKKFEKSQNIKIYYELDWGTESESIIKQIETEIGLIDIYLQDLSAPDFRNHNTLESNYNIENILEANINLAQRNLIYFEKEMSKKESGKIIFLAPSMWDSHKDKMRYEIVKGGITALTRFSAKKMAKSRVNVNCIVPGFIKTDIPTDSSKNLTELINSIPAGYIGDIRDVLNAVLFLSGDASNYVTGQILEVAGGLYD